MENHLSTLVDEARRSGRALSVLLADIDHFKQVNDTYGHDVGDAVLKEFSARFRRNTRGIDLACRFGGEEFLVIMPDTTMARAYQVGERLRVSIASDAFPIKAGVGIHLTASVGLATLERADDTPEIGLSPCRRRAVRRQAARPQSRGRQRGLAPGGEKNFAKSADESLAGRSVRSCSGGLRNAPNFVRAMASTNCRDDLNTVKA